MCASLRFCCCCAAGLSLLYLHGRQKQQKRLEVFQDFVSRTTPCCLISTDLAARGIDFVVQQQRPRGRTGSGSGSQSVSGEGEGSSAVDLVVQFDCPDSVETHIHRVGRTARLTRKGQAVLLLLPSEVSFVEDLQARGVRDIHLHVHRGMQHAHTQPVAPLRNPPERWPFAAPAPANAGSDVSVVAGVVVSGFRVVFC